MLSNPTIARLSEPVVAEALHGFELTAVRPMAWITRGVQVALHCTLRNVEDGPDRQSNADTRNELGALASRASDLWRDIFERSPAADSALWLAAFMGWDGEGGKEVDGVVIGEPSQYAGFTSDLGSLERLASFLRVTANKLKIPQGSWRDAERRELRVERAHWLSPIFEESYGQEATVHDWPNSKSLGPWADFYSRIIAAAFDRHETSNPREVLKEARRRHVSQRVQFAPGLLLD
jgi:hypothetical protein